MTGRALARKFVFPVLVFVAALVAVTAGALYVLRHDDGRSVDAINKQLVIHKHPQCGCCTLWAEHLEAAGINVTSRSQPDATKRWERFGIPPELGACHTAEIDGYIIEGHVPVSDIRRLLEERPDAVGLVVPGMPLGSPGMEAPNPQPYEVLLLNRDGSTEVFERHTPR